MKTIAAMFLKSRFFLTGLSILLLSQMSFAHAKYIVVETYKTESANTDSETLQRKLQDECESHLRGLSYEQVHGEKVVREREIIPGGDISCDQELISAVTYEYVSNRCDIKCDQVLILGSPKSSCTAQIVGLVRKEHPIRSFKRYLRPCENLNRLEGWLKVR